MFIPAKYRTLAKGQGGRCTHAVPFLLLVSYFTLVERMQNYQMIHDRQEFIFSRVARTDWRRRDTHWVAVKLFL